MPPEHLDPALITFAGGMMMFSIIACMNVLHMRRSGPVLPYEPRRPVPWGAMGGVLAMTFLLFAITAALSRGGGEGTSRAADPYTLAIALLEQSFIVGAFAFAIWLFTKGTARDFGLPSSWLQCARDVGIGGAAFLAALAPVLMLQQLLMSIFFPKQTSGHPLIKMVEESPPSAAVFILTGFAAVVVAPVCEEIAFRLLLQGWLERWEDERLGWRRPPINVETEAMLPETIDATVPSNEPADVLPLPAVWAEEEVATNPPARGVFGLPYGWFPIIVSSVAFGLAHIGYGPEPVPLFFLALVLGYLYQRTHRIVPSIVAHALFNSFTMILLWRMIYHRG